MKKSLVVFWSKKISFGHLYSSCRTYNYCLDSNYSCSAGGSILGFTEKSNEQCLILFSFCITQKLPLKSILTAKSLDVQLAERCVWTEELKPLHFCKYFSCLMSLYLCFMFIKRVI